jgi:hypothetical protein
MRDEHGGRPDFEEFDSLVAAVFFCEPDVES